MVYRHFASGPLLRLVPTALLLVSCRTATEVELQLSTDVPCAHFKSAAIYAGSSEATISNAESISTFAYDCQGEGQLGTLVVIPDASKDQPLFIRIVEGIDLDASHCTDQDPEHQCIVTRRQLSFLPHEHLTLPISLDSACRGVVCASNEACQDGTCIDATIDPHTCTADPSRCVLTAQPRPGDAGGQGGAGGASGQGGASGASGTSGQGGQPGAAGSSGSAGAGAGGT